MQISLSLKHVLPMLALVLGIASLVVPRFLNIFVAIFLVAYAAFNSGLIR